MRIRFTADIANRRRGEVVDLDDGSAYLLINNGHARPADEHRDDDPSEATTTGRRAPRRRATSTADEP